MSARTWALWGGPVAAVVLAGLGFGAGLERAAALTAGVTALCAVWWIFEPIPIPATSLVPFAAFPMLGVLSHKEVARAYGDTTILLLLGGFILSTALERSGAHRRLALGMVRLVGGHSRRRLVLGFMLATALCSMWISNTATVLMMLPIAMAVLDRDEAGTLGIPLLLGIAYAASVGGIGTIIGTPPNAIFVANYTQAVGPEKAFDFLGWMMIGVPVSLLMLPPIWLWLVRRLDHGGAFDLPDCGAWRRPEKRVLAVFIVTASLWIFRKTPAGGWSSLVLENGPQLIGDSTIAVFAVVMLFVLPNGEGERMLDWESARRIPWGLLLLFGGGLAIAESFKMSGLSDALGHALEPLAGWPRAGMVLAICLVVTFLTEVTSNTATTSLLMPILAAAGIAAKLDPAMLMVPAALSASCAFMLPVATAPNAIVFGTGRVTTRQMARTGFVLNLIGAAVVTLVCSSILAAR